MPLYAPPINPIGLVAAQATGSSAFAAVSTAPIYRFATYLQRAVELTNDVRAYGSQLLAALEKQDGETLAVMRANQELNIQTLMLNVKTQQVQEATDQITALQNQQAVTQIRYNFYSTQTFPSEWEATALSLQGGAAACQRCGDHSGYNFRSRVPRSHCDRRRRGLWRLTRL